MENNLVDNLNTLHIIQKAVRLGFVFHDIQEIQDIRFAAEEFIEKNKHNSIKDIEDIKKEIALECGEEHFDVLFLCEIEIGDYKTAEKLWNRVGKRYIEQFKKLYK